MYFQHCPKRIVSLQPSATVILATLGRLDLVVACTRYCLEVCPRAKGRIIVADSWTAKTEQILSAKPDVVIASVPYQEKAVVEIMKSGARFLGLSPRNLEDIYCDITCIAGMVGACNRGEQIVREMKRQVAAFHRKTSKLPAVRVFCEEWGKPLIASQPWVAELVEAAGGIFAGVPGAKTSAQDVLQAGPDVLIAAWCGAGDRVPLEKVVRQRGWSNMPAVRNGRVYCIRDEFLNTPAPTLISGLRALAAALHPEHFPQPDGIRSLTKV